MMLIAKRRKGNNFPVGKRKTSGFRCFTDGVNCFAGRFGIRIIS
jgi:hypothetical protein